MPHRDICRRCGRMLRPTDSEDMCVDCLEGFRSLGPELEDPEDIGEEVALGADDLLRLFETKGDDPDDSHGQA